MKRCNLRLLQLETLRRNVSVSREYKDLLEELFNIGFDNLEESGSELLRRVMMVRGLSCKDVAGACGIMEYLVRDICDDKKGISKDCAKKLARLGFSEKAFLLKKKSI